METLQVLEHPWKSLRELPGPAQVPLALFMAIYCPLMFLFAFAWELCWRTPYRRFAGTEDLDERWF